jgi:hypothetical protein
VNKDTQEVFRDYEPSVGAIVEMLKSHWGHENSDRPTRLKLSFVWLPAVVCRHISYWADWAATPFSMPAKPGGACS